MRVFPSRKTKSKSVGINFLHKIDKSENSIKKYCMRLWHAQLKGGACYEHKFNPPPNRDSHWKNPAPVDRIKPDPFLLRGASIEQ